MSSKAQAAKEKGNASFKAGDFPSAIAHYTSAILEDGKDWTFPLNRAAAYLKLGKNEDAERDCTTVLSLNPGNVKALFRRGQARTGITDKLEEAKKDFEEASRLDPKNDSIRSEIERVKTLLSSKKSRRTQPLDIGPPQPTDPSVPRRRVPIKIVRPDGSLVPTPSSATSSGPASATLSAKITVLPSPTSSSSPLPPDSVGTPPAPSTSSPIPTSTATSSQPKTFQDAKRARDVKESQKPQTQSTQDAQAQGQRVYAEAPAAVRTSPVSGRVGGGIFRASGKNQIFASRENKPRMEDVDVDEKITVSGRKGEAKKGDENANASMKLFDFNAKWQNLESSEDRFEFLTTVPPSHLPTMFQTSLEPSLFTSICWTIRDALQHSGDEEIVANVVAYMEAFTKVPRIKTVVLFLDDEEKNIVREIFERLEGIEREEIRAIVGHCRATMKV